MKPDPIAQIDIVEVAKIAASISTPGLTPFRKIEEAYHMLAFANQVKSVSLKTGYSVFWILLNSFKDIDEPEEDPRIIELEVIKSKRGGSEGNVTFKDSLKHLMPEVQKPAVRTKRFMDFLISQRSGLFGMALTQKEAAKAISGFENEGMPWRKFAHFFYCFRCWWPRYKSGVKARAGQAKGKQGRVVRKNDKRKGSRAGSFLKALKKNP